MAEPSKAPRKCNADVKDDTGKLMKCGTVLPKGDPECKNRKQHLLPFVTGFCDSGFHEGTRSKTWEGKPAKVCELWKRCPCKCHKELDQLFAMSGQLRTAQENPEYTPPKSPYWMPSPEERALLHASSNPDPDRGTVIVESPLPDAVPATVRRAFTPTPTGRAGRGELETWVKEACDEWIVEKYDTICSPAWVAEWVVKHKGVATQSQGAVNAVFERWVKLGFAVVEKKPTRFVRYTEEGVRMGLDAMKIRAKTQARRQMSAAMRGVR